ncbi:NACHT domain-containing protein [Candidatus Thiosymbion oneisti]|uniref:NACHT domain-containing protein n=1 Tax=Candidatus Thiosymbion oneisti TaxID=589554 RepID=UPI00105C0073|nr:hypothetical protein [Candidatus Thiosymbion oneisti]
MDKETLLLTVIGTILGSVATIIFQKAYKAIGDTISSILEKLKIRFYLNISWYNRISQKYCNNLVKYISKTERLPCADDRGSDTRIFVSSSVQYYMKDPYYDTTSEILKAGSCILLGNPGCGKSTSLKAIAFTLASQYKATKDKEVTAQTPSPNFNPEDEKSKSYVQIGPKSGEEVERLHKKLIPVIIEIKRFNEVKNLDDKSIMDQIEACFSRSDIPNALPFIKELIKQRKLIILFDGLDEICHERRFTIRDMINDFITQTKFEISVVISCRTRAYRRDEFPGICKVFDLCDFDDKQIRDYLDINSSCLNAEPNRILASIKLTPRIHQLARNPFYLRLMIELHSECNFSIPHSRTSFLDRTIDKLLQKREELCSTRFSIDQKKLVLQHIALAFQDLCIPGDEQLLSGMVLREHTENALKSIGKDENDASDLIDDFVHVHGILVEIEGGGGCMFIHQLIQEYFVAKCFIDDGDSLLKRFSVDNERYREVMRIWFGFNRNCTPWLDEVFRRYPRWAFELLAEVKDVSSDLVRQLLDSLSDDLKSLCYPTPGENNNIPEIFERETSEFSLALAAIATSETWWGQEVYKKLESLVDDFDVKKPAYIISVAALSKTYKQEAASTLVESLKKLNEEILAVSEKMNKIKSLVDHPLNIVPLYSPAASLAYLIRRGYLPDFDMYVAPRFFELLDEKDKLSIILKNFGGIKQKLLFESARMGDVAIDAISELPDLYEDGKKDACDILSGIQSERAMKLLSKLLN